MILRCSVFHKHKNISFESENFFCVPNLIQSFLNCINSSLWHCWACIMHLDRIHDFFESYYLGADCNTPFPKQRNINIIIQSKSTNGALHCFSKFHKQKIYYLFSTTFNLINLQRKILFNIISISNKSWHKGLNEIKYHSTIQNSNVIFKIDT